MCSSAFLHPSQVKSRSKSNLINSQHKKNSTSNKNKTWRSAEIAYQMNASLFNLYSTHNKTHALAKRTWRIDDVQVNVPTLYVQVLESTKHETRQFSESAYHTNENSGRQIIGVKYALQHGELCTTTTTKTTITANTYACVYPKTR